VAKDYQSYLSPKLREILQVSIVKGLAEFLGKSFFGSEGWIMSE